MERLRETFGELFDFAAAFVHTNAETMKKEQKGRTTNTSNEHVEFKTQVQVVIPLTVLSKRNVIYDGTMPLLLLALRA